MKIKFRDINHLQSKLMSSNQETKITIFQFLLFWCIYVPIKQNINKFTKK